jgi:hypothetical protein
VLNFAKTRARSIAPIAVAHQLKTVMLPKLAKDAGSKKTPDPIIFPTTKAVNIHTPNFLFICSHSI